MLLGLWPSREAVFLCFYKTKKKKKKIQTPFWSNQYLTLLSFANKRFGTTYINFINKHIVQWRLLLLFSFCFSFVLFLFFPGSSPSSSQRLQTFSIVNTAINKNLKITISGENMAWHHFLTVPITSSKLYIEVSISNS